MQRDARAISAEKNAVELQALGDSVMVLSEQIEFFFKHTVQHYWLF